RELVALGELVDRAATTGEPCWLHPTFDDLPPQLEPLLREYVDLAHVKLVGVVPLHAPASRRDEDNEAWRPELIGALVIEQFNEIRPSQALQTRTSTVSEHAATALANALSHEGTFL